MNTGLSHGASGMKPHASLGTSIAIAESISSAVSLGSVWLLGRNPQLIAPVKEFITHHIIYPIMNVDAAKSDDDVLKQAQQRASLLLKGVVMLGTSFISHIPTQMFLEGRSDFNEFKKVVFGKSLGLATAMGGLALINAIKPGTVNAIEDKISNALFHCDEAHPTPHDEANKELCKLMIIDIPSSMVSGLVNYQLARRL